MLVAFLALVLIAIWGAKFRLKGFYGEGAFSKDVTDSVKGIFIWLVFFRHSLLYVEYTGKLDLPALRIDGYLGQLIVACFLFYSGYGVCEAIKKKGTDYLRRFPKHRVLKPLIHFDIAVMINFVTQLLLGNRFSFTRIIFGFLGWESLGNSNWYIFVILVLYLITWISFSLFKRNAVIPVFAATVLIGFLTVFLYLTRPIWWYDTILCYVLGMYVSILKDRFISFVTKNNIIWASCTALCVILFIPLHSNIGTTAYAISTLSRMFIAPIFATGIVLLLMKVRISNKVLVFSGRHLFEIFILHRIPLAVFKELGIAEYNCYVFFVLSLVCTVILSVMFKYLTDRIDKLIFK